MLLLVFSTAAVFFMIRHPAYNTRRAMYCNYHPPSNQKLSPSPYIDVVMCAAVPEYRAHDMM